MLCAKCHEREATVHFTKIDGDKVTKRDFCEECAGPYLCTEQDVRPLEPFIPRIGTLKRPPAIKVKLCDKCHEREATIHVCKIDGNNTTTSDFCEECGKNEMGASKLELKNLLGTLESGQPETAMRLESLKAALGVNTRYPIEAYDFLGEALDTCFSGSHVSACVLLKAIRELALKKFGKRAKAALAEWKIFRTEDFGEIVFEMIDAGVLGSTPEDSKEDFQNGFNFGEAFPEG